MPKSYPFCVGVASMMPCSWSSMPSPKMRGPAPHMPVMRHHQACAEACWALLARSLKQAETEIKTKQSLKAQQDQSENALCGMQRSIAHRLGCCTRAYTAAGSLEQQQILLPLCIKLEANCRRMPSMHLLCACRRAQSAVDLPLGCSHLTLSQAAALRVGSGLGVSLVMPLAVPILPSLLST